jgi:hypothetical protein
MELSAPEQHLLNFISEQFGEPLSQFLLAGLGEEEVGQRWRFTITFVNPEGTKLKRHVQVLSHEPADGSSCLPRGRNSLVLLALIQLLIRSSTASQHSLLYAQEEVLNLLGWDDNQETRGEIDETLRRYSLMMFKWKMNRSEAAHNKLSYYTAMERLISEYGTVDEEEEGQMKRVFNRVIFNSNFIEHLKHRSLFGINWNSGLQLIGALKC